MMKFSGPLLMNDASKKQMREHVQDWIRKYHRLDSGVVQYLRHWARSENHFIRVRMSLRPSSEIQASRKKE